ncbi:MAG: peptidase U35, partial [Deltaproteobacteria bacterium]|nr:peptidase U35 [Deltaproteobacteria bacterium]
IRAMCDRFNLSDMADDLIRSNTQLDQARKKVLDKIGEQNKDLDGGAGHRAPIEVTTDEREKFRAAAGDSLILRAGTTIDRPAPGAEELRGMMLRELAREALVRANERIPANVIEMVGRALTTSDFPYILADVANKSLLAGWDAAQETWQKWCGTGSVNDFKTQNLLRASETDDLDEIGETGEYKYGDMDESREQYAIATYGKLFKISRQTIINDDLNALTGIPAKHGEAAARKVGDIAYAVLIANAAMGDGVALFHEDHGNLMTGSDVDITNLGLAIKAMKLQKDIKGKRRLNIRPQFFIAPVALEGPCEQLFNSEFEGTQAKPGLKNIYGGSYFTRVYEPRLDDDDANAWYLAGPKDMTVKVFFLNGVQRPFLDTKQGWNVDGVEYKVRIDAGAKAVDWRGLVKNPGAS